MSIKDEIRYVSAQPDELYFIWQTDVYLTNFISLGIPQENCVALFGAKPGVQASAELFALRAKFPDVDIRVYPDTRDLISAGYQASVQPHLIDKALEQSPHWETTLTFYHDSDIAFQRLPDFDAICSAHPHACVLSDTRNYIGYEYLHACCKNISADNPSIPKDELVFKMCEVVGIDVQVLRDNEIGSGGAQYLLNGVGRAYWQKVYSDSVAIRTLFDKYFTAHKLPKTADDYIQIWTAGMWSYLWNLWLFGFETVVHPELNFSFGSAPSSDSSSILHMTGLEKNQKYFLFNKSDWSSQSPIAVLKKQPFLFDHCPVGSVARDYTDLIYQTAAVARPNLGPAPASRHWRVLAWSVLSDADIWDVEHLEFIVDTETDVVCYFDSGNAGPGYEVANATTTTDTTYWGGRLEHKEGCKACFYLGIELEKPAQPNIIKLTQALSPHVTEVAIVQCKHDDTGDWITVEVAKLDPGLLSQTIYYRSDQGHKSNSWRIVADTTSSKFAWDVYHLAFMANEQEQRGRAFSSGYCDADDSTLYGPDNAFQCNSALWGGRANASKRFVLGIEVTQCVPVNRVVLQQGTDNWAERISIQVKDDKGYWHNFRTVENLSPGYNTIVLFN